MKLWKDSKRFYVVIKSKFEHIDGCLLTSDLGFTRNIYQAHTFKLSYIYKMASSGRFEAIGLVNIEIIYNCSNSLKSTCFGSYKKYMEYCINCQTANLILLKIAQRELEFRKKLQNKKAALKSQQESQQESLKAKAEPTLSHVAIEQDDIPIIQKVKAVYNGIIDLGLQFSSNSKMESFINQMISIATYKDFDLEVVILEELKAGLNPALADLIELVNLQNLPIEFCNEQGKVKMKRKGLSATKTTCVTLIGKITTNQVSAIAQCVDAANEAATTAKPTTKKKKSTTQQELF